MKNTGVIITCTIAIICITFIYSLEVIPERAAVSYMNKKYIKSAVAYVRRYARNRPYTLTMDIETLITFGHNMSIQILFYEFLNNEYKRTFVEMNYKLCDILEKDPIFSPLFKAIDLTCPIYPQHINLANLTFISVSAVENFPYKWPFEKGKAEAYFRVYPTKELVGYGYLVLRFKDALKAKKM